MPEGGYFTADRGDGSTVVHYYSETIGDYTTTRGSVTFVGVPLCPDLLRYEQLGEADHWRGRIVRAFFWLLDRGRR